MSEAERFGDYLLVDRIAQGGMAELFLAKRTGVEGFEKVVAIKRILPEFNLAQDFVAMFINEAKIAARLTHPNIVQIFDFGKVEDHYFIAMEYVHGENLRTVLNRAKDKGLPFPHDLAAMVVAKTCAALDHAHRKLDERGNPLHIIHRDISPQNVLASFDGEVKVVDFGIAKAVAENPEATRGVLKGKLAYLSPEQVTGRSLDARADVFATGAVLFELLAGHRLFDQKSSGEVLDAIVRIDSAEVARRLPNLHPRMREILERSLQGDREKRYASAGEMQRALDDYLRGRGDSAGTLQLSSFLRLLFDEKMGDRTLEQLRSEVLKTIETPVPGSRKLPSLPVPPRIAAAAVGAALGLVALLVVAPRSDTATPPDEPLVEEGARDTADDTQMAVRRPVEEPVAPDPAPVREPAADENLPAEEPEVPPEPGHEDAELALAALEAGRSREAIEGFERAFATAPALRENHAEDYGRALAAEGKRLFEAESPEAVGRLETAIDVAPRLFEPYFYLAKIRTRDSEFDAAAELYRDAIRIDPDHADARFNLGYLYIRKHQYEEALTQYRKTLELRPPYLEDVVYNLSVCYERLGRKDEAIAALRNGLKEAPNSQLLQQRLRQLGG